MDTVEECKREADAWYTRYAKDEGISLTEAKKAAYAADIEELERKAKYFVANRDDKAIAFSPEANREMKEYNFSMKISRHELLMRNIELALNQMSDKAVSILGDYLSDMAGEELVRQAGLLGMVVSTPEEITSRARTIANSSFHDMTFSERVWANQKTLQDQIERGVTKSIMMGKNPTTWMRTLHGSMDLSFENANYAMKRLAVTESGRVQIEAQEESYKAAGYDKYMVICEPTACDICTPHDGKTYPVSAMQQGINSPMFHPFCKCSTAAHMDRSEVEDAFADLDAELAAINAQFVAPEATPLSVQSGNVFYKGINDAYDKVLDHGNKTGNECLTLVDLKGKEAFPPLYGARDHVVLTKPLVDLLNTSPPNSFIPVHNHPSGASFLTPDLVVMSLFPSIKQMRVVGHNGYKYHVSIGTGIRPDTYDVQQVYAQERLTLQQKYQQKVNAGMSHTEAWQEHSHETMKAVAKHYGWNYRRRRK